MKLLLDENIPIKLKYRFTEKGINAFTVRDMKWLGMKNGDLLKAMIENDFTFFMTVDNNLSFQNNFHDYPIAVIVLIAHDNTYDTIMKSFNEIFNSLQETFTGSKVILSKI
jgi:predicted nuclease of predicted toxin-antitoxin system